MTTLSEELSWRGFVNQMTFAEIEDVNEPRTFYWGVDPSADSMTIGNLAPAMMIRHFLDHGHKAILLVGGATGMIGDPDGKKQERDLKSIDELTKNREAISAQYSQIFAGQDFEIVDNYDWFSSMGYLEFLREVGKHASMTQMLDREFIKARIGEGGEGISYAEFSYALIQGYDFLHLYREKGATLQVAGADQWGNSITGVQLIRRIERAESHVFTAPLIINKQTGVKFGKSEGGAIWLDPNKTSPYKFYQFWLNTDDTTAEDLIKIYTLLSKDVIDQLITEHKSAPHTRVLQRTLAREVTALVHGADRTESVISATLALFSKEAGIPSDAVLDTLKNELPVVAIGKSITEALLEVGYAESLGDARRNIMAGAVSFNGVKLSQDDSLSTKGLLKKGKNSFAIVL